MIEEQLIEPIVERFSKWQRKQRVDLQSANTSRAGGGDGATTPAAAAAASPPQQQFCEGALATLDELLHRALPEPCPSLSRWLAGRNFAPWRCSGAGSSCGHECALAMALALARNAANNAANNANGMADGGKARANIAGMRLRYLQQADSPRLLRMSEVERENASAACRSAVEFQTGCEQHSGAVPHFCKKAVMERRGIVTR